MKASSISSSPNFLGLVLALGLACLILAGGDQPEQLRASGVPPGFLIVDGVTVRDIGVLREAVPIPQTNPIHPQKINLGKQLFFDGRLSRNNQVSCSHCHIPSAGFSDPHPTSSGVDDQLGGRQAPSILNTAFNPLQFWDGRVSSLEEQAAVPIQNPIEMAEIPDHLLAKLRTVEGYRRQFGEVFGTDIGLQGIVEAIATYERTLISTNSAFDRYMLGDSQAMQAPAIRGMALFRGKARCILCHNGPNFTDNQFHNLGVPQDGPLKEDLGRYLVTRHDRDRGAFKTPTLRSIVETAPYMHDGVFLTLEEVIDFLDQGGGGNPTLSPLMKRLGLTQEEKTDLLAFLEALTGESLQAAIDPPTLP